MSYETHVTMAINCITTSVYIYAVVTLIEVCLFMMPVAAKTVPPTDYLSLLFNLWFGIVTFGIIMAMRTLLFSLFFSDAYKLKIVQPDCSFVTYNKHGSALNYTVHQTNDNTVSLGAALLKINLAECPAAGSKPSEPTQTAKPTQAAKTPQAPSKSPGTPDSLTEERSQADTEVYGDAKSEIQPCSD